MSDSTIEVLRLVQMDEPCTAKEVADQVQYNDGTVSERLSELHQIGILARKKRKGKSESEYGKSPFEYEFIQHIPFEEAEYPVSSLYSLAEKAVIDNQTELRGVQEHLFESHLALSNAVQDTRDNRTKWAAQSLADAFNHLVFAYDMIESTDTSSSQGQQNSETSEDVPSDLITEALAEWDPAHIPAQKAKKETRRVVEWLRSNDGAHTPHELKSNLPRGSVNVQHWWENMIQPGLSVLVESGLIEYRFAEQDYRWIGEEND